MQNSPAVKFHKWDYWSYKPKKNYDVIELILIVLFPYFLEIFFLILSTINVFFLESPFKVSVARYTKVSIYYQAFALWLIGSLIVCKRKKKIFKDHGFYFFLFILVRFLSTVNSYAKSGGFGSNQTLAPEIADTIFTIVLSLAALSGLIFYFCYSPIVTNGLKKIFFSGPFINDNGFYYLTPYSKLDWKKAGSALFRMFCWTLFVINVYVVVSIIVEKITQNFSPVKGPSESRNNEIVKAALKDKNTMFTTLLHVLIFAPIAEELVFRHITLQLFGASGLGVFVSSLTFGLMHLNHQEPITLLIQYSIPAAIFGYVYCRYKNLWFSVGMHFLYNFNAVIWLLFP